MTRLGVFFGNASNENEEFILTQNRRSVSVINLLNLKYYWHDYQERDLCSHRIFMPNCMPCIHAFASHRCRTYRSSVCLSVWLCISKFSSHLNSIVKLSVKWTLKVLPYLKRVATILVISQCLFKILTSFWRRAGYGVNANLTAPVCYETAPCINGSTRR